MSVPSPARSKHVLGQEWISFDFNALRVANGLDWVACDPEAGG